MDGDAAAGVVEDFPFFGEPCDGCGDDAVVRVVLSGGGVLVFCGACWRRHEIALREEATAIRG